MQSFVDVVGIPNNVPVDVGPVRFGIGWLTPGPPPTATVIVMPHDDPESQEHRVGWGETFPVGSETWRFADVEFDSADQWRVVLRRIDPDAPLEPLPPLTDKRVWLPIELRPYGTLDETQLESLERALGRELPPSYRRWLAENNGAQPVGDHHVPGLYFALFEQRPLFGVHPEYPAFDLVNADRQYRARWLPEEYVVIAAPSGGLLAVKTTYPGYDAVMLLPEASMSGAGGPETAQVMERHLRMVSPDFYHFLGRLQPMTVPD